MIQNNAGLEELHLEIRSSKTDQARNSTTHSVRQQANHSIFTVRLMKMYLQVRKQLDESQLYVHVDGSLLTRYQFSSVLQKSWHFVKYQIILSRIHLE